MNFWSHVILTYYHDISLAINYHTDFDLDNDT